MNEEYGKYSFCPQCGSQLSEGTCPHCGYRLQGVYSGGGQGIQSSNDTVFKMSAEDKRRKNLNTTAIFAGIIGGLILLVCTIVGFFGISKAIKEFQYQEQKEYESDNIAPSEVFPEEVFPEEVFPEEEFPEEEFFDILPFDAEKYLKDKDYFLDRDYRNKWGGSHTNYARSEFSGDFYNNVCDSIDYSVPYKIVRKYGEYSDPRETLTIRFSYIQLEGDIPNIEELNQEIKESSADFTQYYYSQYFAWPEDNEDMYMESDSYITYNDETILSIVLTQEMETEYEFYSVLCGLNIDLATGTILTNSTILDVDTQFAEDFKKRSLNQNGSVDFVAMGNKETISDYLRNDDCNIFFYTPLGMEVGYNHYLSRSNGWVTVTYKDYQDFLNYE